MTVTEQARHRLHGHLEEIMGEEHAAALMEWLPAGPLASKADIDQMREVMDLRFDAMREEMRAGFAELRAEFQHELRVQSFVTVGSIASIAGVVAAVVNLL